MLSSSFFCSLFLSDIFLLSVRVDAFIQFCVVLSVISFFHSFFVAFPTKQTEWYAMTVMCKIHIGSFGFVFASRTYTYVFFFHLYHFSFLSVVFMRFWCVRCNSFISISRVVSCYMLVPFSICVFSVVSHIPVVDGSLFGFTAVACVFKVRQFISSASCVAVHASYKCYYRSLSVYKCPVMSLKIRLSSAEWACLQIIIFFRFWYFLDPFSDV